jgi:hypothetical protein
LLANADLSEGEQRALRQYLAGLIAIRVGDSTQLGNARQSLGRMIAGNRLALPLSEALAGHLAQRRGDMPAALAAFEQSIVALPLRVRAQVPALAQYADRQAYAQVLRAVNRPADASRWEASLRDGASVWGAAYFGTGSGASSH